MPLVDKPDTELARKHEEGINFVTLYDPPVDGRTPVDGEGKPMSSVIVLRDVPSKLEQGFTREPVRAKKR